MIQLETSHGLVLAFGLPGHSEWLILLVLGLLIFGRRLPEVGRSLGRSIVEFKRGIKGISDDIEDESSRAGSEPERLPDESRKSELPKAPVGDEARNPYSPVEQKARDD
jgi:sec-independent protein translocase protein TatA